MTYKIKLFILAILATASLTTWAKEVRQVSVANGETVTDIVSLDGSSRDMNVTVKFVFNENENTLTVSLLSFRNLFVFQSDVRYKSCFHKSYLSMPTLKPELLPYVVEPIANTSFRMPKKVRKMLPTKPKKYTFHQWIKGDGLQPIAGEYALVNDYLEQVFDIKPQRNKVAITIRDILVMDKDERTSKTNYDFVHWSDLNLTYSIELRRDPCFGQETAVELSASSLDAIKLAYETLVGNYPNQEVETDKMKATFDKSKETLIAKYPPVTTDSKCPNVQDNWKAYNLYTDSISALERTVKVNNGAGGKGGKGGKGGGGSGLDAATIYSYVKQIDKSVAQWLATSDRQERRDIELICADINRNVEKLIKAKGARTAEQKKAVKVFRQATRYYKNIINGPR